MDIIKYNEDDGRTYGKVLGDNGEQAVINYMRADGYKLLARNYSIHNVGELDAVFEKDGDIYIVEVKARQVNSIYTSPEESITPAKYRRLVKTANIFIAKNNLYDSNISFLIGVVEHNRDGLIQNVKIVPF